jgi:endo-1,4-beta-D-glucanase Y
MNILHAYDCSSLTPFTIVGSGVSTRATGGIDGDCIQLVAPSTSTAAGFSISKPFTDNLKIMSFWFRPLFNSINSTSNSVIARIYTSTASTETESFRLLVKKVSAQKYQVGIQDVATSTVTYATKLLDKSFDLDLNALASVPAGGLTDPYREDLKAATIGLSKFLIEVTDTEVKLFINSFQLPALTITLNSANKNITKVFFGSDLSANLSGSTLLYDDIRLGKIETAATTREAKAISAAKGWLDRFVTNNGCQIRYSFGEVDDYVWNPSYNQNMPVVDVTVTTQYVETAGNTFNGSPVFIPNNQLDPNAIYRVQAVNEVKYITFNGVEYKKPQAYVDNLCEGVGYALRMAAATNNQVLFDKIENFTEANITRKNSKPNTIPANEASKATNCMHWKYNTTCKVSMVTDVATDGDEDRAIALLEAHLRWGSAGAINYKARSIAIAEDIWTYISSPFTVSKEELRVPVISLNTVNYNNSLANPSYFNAHFWKMLEVVTHDQKWKKMTRGIYAMMKIANDYNSSGMPNNFIPFSWDGTIRTVDLENDENWNRSSYDAVRYSWRAYQDYAVNQDYRAIDSVKKGATFILSNSFNNAQYFPIIKCKTGQFLGSIENISGISSRLFSNKAIGETALENTAATTLFNKYNLLAEGGTLVDNFYSDTVNDVPSSYYNGALGVIGTLLYTNQLTVFPKIQELNLLKKNTQTFGIKIGGNLYKLKDY